MKKRIYILGIVLGILVIGGVSIAAADYGLDGFVKFSNGTQCSEANVSIMNQRTGEYIYNNTGWGGANFEGYYLQDAGNFPSSYIDGDNLTYYTTIAGYDNTSYHTISVPGANTMNITLNPTGGTNASVTVYSGSITFGNLQLNDGVNTESGGTQAISTAGADGNQLIEIKLNSSTVLGDNNGTALTFVSGSPALDQLRCQFKGGDAVSYTALTISYQNYDDVMAASSNSSLDIQLTMPSSVSTVSYYDTYQYEIIVRATLL